MASFMIGTVLEPEIIECKTKETGIRRKVEFGLLVGRNSTVFSVWDDNDLFESVCSLVHGDLICVVVGYGVDKNGKLLVYLNRVASCPPDLRDALQDLF